MTVQLFGKLPTWTQVLFFSFKHWTLSLPSPMGSLLLDFSIIKLLSFMLNQTPHIQSRNHIIFKRIYKLRNFRIHITHSGKDCITVTLCQRQYLQGQNTEHEKRECIANNSHSQFSRYFVRTKCYSHLTEV